MKDNPALEDEIKETIALAEETLKGKCLLIRVDKFQTLYIPHSKMRNVLIDNMEAVQMDTNENKQRETEIDNEPDLKTAFMRAKSNVIGKNIREHRKYRRLKVEDIAYHLDLSLSYIRLLERGDRYTCLKLVYKLCNLYNVSPNEILPADQTSQDNIHGETIGKTGIPIDAFSSLIKMLSASEIDFIIDTIKNLKNIRTN